MDAIASQITSLVIVHTTVYPDAYQRKHQSSAELAFVRGIHRGPVNSLHKGPVTRKMFSFDDVIMGSLGINCRTPCTCSYSIPNMMIWLALQDAEQNIVMVRKYFSIHTSVPWFSKNSLLRLYFDVTIGHWPRDTIFMQRYITENLLINFVLQLICFGLLPLTRRHNPHRPKIPETDNGITNIWTHRPHIYHTSVPGYYVSCGQYH